MAELPNKWARAAVAGNIYSTTKVENLLVELGGTVSALNGGYGSFTLHDGTAANGDVTGNWNNIYIVSSIPCTVTSADKVIDGENRDCENTYTGIKRYDTLADMISNKNYLGEETLSPNDYSSFTESGCWHLSEDGIPVFGAN